MTHHPAPAEKLGGHRSKRGQAGAPASARDDSPLASRGSTPRARPAPSAASVDAAQPERLAAPAGDRTADIADSGSPRPPRAAAAPESGPATAARPPPPGAGGARRTADPAYLADKLRTNQQRALAQSRGDTAAAAKAAAAKKEGLVDHDAEQFGRGFSVPNVRAHLAAKMSPVHEASFAGPCPAVVATHLGSRYPQMEDAHAVKWFEPVAGHGPRVGIMAVFDGHGGAQTSHMLAERGADAVHAHLAPALAALAPDAAPDDVGIYAALKNAFAPPRGEPEDPARPSLHGLAQSTRPGGDSAAVPGAGGSLRPYRDGSTVAMAVIVGRTLYVAGLGDSRVTLIPRAAPAERLSTDHRPEDAREADKISGAARGGFVMRAQRNGKLRTEGRLATSRAVGDEEIASLGRRPDIVRLAIDPARHLALALATDGITDVLHDGTVGAVVNGLHARAGGGDAVAAATLADAARLTVGAAALRGSTDNKTMMLVDLTGPG